jgi:thioredoxin reductase (NADPH)
VFRARFVLLATGARRRTLGVPGERDELGRGLSPAARRYGDQFAGRTVLVVGGSDVALEEAALFSRVCDRVILAHRGTAFRGRADFRADVEREDRIDVRFGTTLLGIEGEPSVEAALLRGPSGPYREEVAAVVVCAGLAPNSELVASEVRTDPQGYVITDVQQRSSEARLYAAGDVCAGSAWSVAAAIGQAAIAVKDMERRLNAEGSG